MKTLRALLCLVLGHRWARVREVCHRRSFPFEMAGCEAICGRCGFHYVDQCGECRTTGEPW